MLWIIEEKVFSKFDYGTNAQRCRSLDLHGFCSDVRGENPEAPPPHFYHYLYLVIRLEWTSCLWTELRQIWELETTESLVVG